MQIKDIHELIKLVAKYNVSELLIEEKDMKVCIKNKDHVAVTAMRESSAVVQTPPPVTAAMAPTPTTQSIAPQIPEKTETPPSEQNLITIKSPMIGTFYRRPSPDKEPYVKVGDVIKPGTILCTIEAMKLFNEIESEVSGKIVEILVEDASPVEYDQPLFIVQPL